MQLVLFICQEYWMFLFFFLLISQTLLYVSTVSYLLNRKLSLSSLSVLHIFVNSVIVLSKCTHRPVCTPFYLCSRHVHMWLWMPRLGSVKTYQERKCAPQASLYHLPHLSVFFFFLAVAVYIGTQQFSLIWVLHLLLLVKLGLLLAPVLLE